jgi:hypothetical protein
MEQKGLLGKLMRGVTKVANMLVGKSEEKFKPYLMGTSNVSMRDKELPSDEWVVKHKKLGSSFFTRQRNPRTRSRLIAGLSAEEKQIARAKGWIR